MSLIVLVTKQLTSFDYSSGEIFSEICKTEVL